MDHLGSRLLLAEDKLFATLDTRARQLRLLDGREVVLTDTVGFIREMPKDLFAAFRATFEEAADADLILEVVDASDPELDEHMTTTKRLLRDLELDLIPRIVVYNKVDLLPEGERTARENDPGAVTTCALEKGATRALLRKIAEELEAAGKLAASPVPPDVAIV